MLGNHRKALSLLALVAILPTLMILRLALVEHANVFDHIVAQRAHELSIGHIVIQAATIPIFPAIVEAVPVITIGIPSDEFMPSRRAEKVAQARAEALNGIGAAINVDSTRVEIVERRLDVLDVFPAILQTREFLGISRVCGFPRRVQRDAKRRELAVLTHGIIGFEGRIGDIVELLKHRVLRRIVCIHRTNEIKQTVAIIELVIANRMETVARAQGLSVAAALIGAEIRYIAAQVHRTQPGRGPSHRKQRHKRLGRAFFGIIVFLIHLHAGCLGYIIGLRLPCRACRSFVNRNAGLQACRMRGR